MNRHSPADTRCCAVVELRQYTLKPGRREALIDLFERYFIEGQESVGMTVIGQFRDRHRPDRFVWLRGFPDMQRRHEALEAFYGGPIWAAHREQANDTMLDSDDVLLLKPARANTGFLTTPRAASGTFQNDSTGSVLAGIHQMPAAVDDATVAFFEEQVVSILHTNGVQLQGLFVTEAAPNTFRRLPVREGEHVVVWFGTPEGLGSQQNWRERLASIVSLGRGQTSLLELEPTLRSSLGAGADR